MPTPSTKLAIPLPLGNEVVRRAAFLDMFDAVDANAASQAQADRPFYLKSAVYDSGNNRLAVVVGPGRARINGLFVNQAGDASVYVAAPIINTTYFVYLLSDGTYATNTSGTAPANGVLLWSVTTGATLTAGIGSADQRPELPSGDAAAAASALTAHKTATPLDHPAGSITDTHVAPANKDGLAGTASLRTLGTGAQQAAVGSHTHAHAALSAIGIDDHHARSHGHTGADGSGTVAYADVTGKPAGFTPAAHAASHAPGGTDDVSASYVKIGTVNADLVRRIAAVLQVDTRYRTYAYDAQGRLATETLFAANGGATLLTTTYAYNADGTINTVTEALPGGAPNTVVTTYGGYAGGLPTTESRTYS